MYQPERQSQLFGPFRHSPGRVRVFQILSEVAIASLWAKCISFFSNKYKKHDYWTKRKIHKHVKNQTLQDWAENHKTRWFMRNNVINRFINACTYLFIYTKSISKCKRRENHAINLKHRLCRLKQDIFFIARKM